MYIDTLLPLSSVSVSRIQRYYGLFPTAAARPRESLSYFYFTFGLQVSDYMVNHYSSYILRTNFPQLTINIHHNVTLLSSYFQLLIISIYKIIFTYQIL